MNLVDIYFYSRFTTSSIYFSNTSDAKSKVSNVHFKKKYDKNIFNIGKAAIYEYSLGTSSMVEDNTLHIIILNINSNPNNEDYTGIVINSFGIDWYDAVDGFSYPIHRTRLRGNYWVKVPLFFDGKQFVPFGHFGELPSDK